MEFNDGTWSAFEIKLASERNIEKAIKDLKNIKNKVVFEKIDKCRGLFVITSGNKSYEKDGVKIISLYHLFFK
jgi:hypothetical protein